MDEKTIAALRDWAGPKGIIWSNLSRGDCDYLIRNLARAIVAQDEYIATLSDRCDRLEEAVRIMTNGGAVYG